MAIQRAYFPMDVIKVSQGYGVGTHRYSYALDLSGKDSGKDKVYAPFDCKITKLYQPKNTKTHATTVWLTSTQKVLSPNGRYDYLTIAITHPQEIMKMRKGCTYKQGEVICYEGTTGLATGNHIHLEVSTASKLISNAGWQVIKGNYVNKAKVKPEEYLFVKKGSTIFQGAKSGTVRWMNRESDLIVHVNARSGLNMRTKPSTAGKVIKVLKNNTEVVEFYKEHGWSYILSGNDFGYVSSNYLK